MRDKIIKELKKLAKEEYGYATVEDKPAEKEFYARPGRFIIERRTLSGLSGKDPTLPICVRTHLPMRHFPEHAHDYVEVMYVYSGVIEHIICGNSITVNAGEIIVLGKNTEHSIMESGEDDLAVNLIISCDLFELLLGEIRKGSELSTSKLQTMLDKEKNIYMLYRTSRMGDVANIIDNIVMTGLLLPCANGYILERSTQLLLSLLCKEDSDTKSGESCEMRLLNYIRTSYSTATLTECAEMLGLSPSYLSRWCTRCFGLSFKDLVMNERFAAACELLEKTDMPVGDIIVNSGYENSSYFHKEFKKRYGTTPHKYRKTKELL